MGKNSVKEQPVPQHCIRFFPHCVYCSPFRHQLVLTSESFADFIAKESCELAVAKSQCFYETMKKMIKSYPFPGEERDRFYMQQNETLKTDLEILLHM